MAEMLVMTVNSGLMHKGDVVTIQPDGWQWGSMEYGPDAYPIWRVIKVPGAPVHALRELLDEPVRDGRAILYRRLGLDLTQIGESTTIDRLLAARLPKSNIPLVT